MNFRYLFTFLLRRILHVIILLFGIYYTLPSFADESFEREVKIKIAYLFHFNQFTEWTTKLPVFNYCVYENAHFSELLKQAYQGKKHGDMEIEIRNISAQSNVDNCQLIYFPNDISTDLLAKIRKKPILSVGTQKGFIEQGGIIYLFEENQKIRFFINNTGALAAGLKINSQLLALSKDPAS